MSDESSQPGPAARVNGRAVMPRDGETILAAASRHGIEIPTLCFDERFPAEGGCRMCLVHCEGSDRPLAACYTPLEAGMDIQTHHVAVEKFRKSLLTLHIESAEQTEFDPAAIRPGRFSELLQIYGVDRPARKKGSSAVFRDRSHPIINQTPGACIHCRLCVSACGEAEGQFVFGTAGRGSRTRVVKSGERNLLESSCVACGACVDVCPTGAMNDRDRRRSVPADPVPEKTETVCGFCSVGCRISVTASEDQIRKIDPVRKAETNAGLLCQKGRFGHTFQFSWDRLSQPMIRQGAGFREVSWEKAFEFTAGRIREILGKSGPAGFGGLASTRATNESNYLFQKLFRTVLGTNNIDSSARLCHAGTIEILREATGTGAATASLSDIEEARCLVVAGANPADSHPVLGARIRQAVRNGARLIVIDPRRTELADIADVFLRIAPGSDIAVFLTIARLLVEDGGSAARDSIANLVEFEAFLGKFPIDAVPDFAGVPAEPIQAAAELLAEARDSVLFLPGTGLTQQTRGTAAIRALLNLAILSGSFGKPGAGVLPPGGQNNLQGCLDMGAAPDLLPGGFLSSDGLARGRLQDFWGTPIPASGGLNSREMIAAANRNELKALWVMGHDLLHSHPVENEVVAGLEKLDLLIVQDLFYSDLCRNADIILPAASFFEQAGTFTNAERRVQRIRPAVSPPEQARPDWAIVTLVARRLGADWPYQDASQIFAEIARVAPEKFGGMTDFRFENEPDGIQWPCPDPDHPGTRTLPAPEKFSLFTAGLPVNPEHDIDGFPYLLITGRRLEHYNGGSMTRRNPGRHLFDHDTIEIHPGDALRDGILDGDTVRVESRHGDSRIVARISDRIRPGTAFLTFHFPQTHANRIVGPSDDPESGCPQFKATAVRITPEESEQSA